MPEKDYGFRSLIDKLNVKKGSRFVERRERRGAPGGDSRPHGDVLGKLKIERLRRYPAGR